MGVLVDCSNLRYAVIQASSKHERPERLVIAYEDENCLRDLIAAPSIFGLGFLSREAAMANLEGNTSGTASSKREPRITAMFHGTQENRVLARSHGPVKHRGMPQHILRSALATVIVLLYSKNIVSVVIRMALGGSF
jgi:hypothetical protein